MSNSDFWEMSALIVQTYSSASTTRAQAVHSKRSRCHRLSSGAAGWADDLTVVRGAAVRWCARRHAGRINYIESICVLSLPRRWAYIVDGVMTPEELLTTTRSVRRRLDLTRPVPREL